MPNDEERIRKADFFHSLSLNSYNAVLNLNSTIDTKIHNSLNLLVGLVPILFGVFYYLVTKSPVLVFSAVIIISVAYGVMMFMLAIIIGLWGYKLADFLIFDPYKFVNEHKGRTLPEIMEITVASIGDMTRTNSTSVKTKAFAYKVMLLFMMMGGIGFSIGFMFLLSSLLF